MVRVLESMMPKFSDELIRQYQQEIASLGGKARAAKLTKEQRRRIARRAAKARWGKRNGR